MKNIIINSNSRYTSYYFEKIALKNINILNNNINNSNIINKMQYNIRKSIPNIYYSIYLLSNKYDNNFSIHNNYNKLNTSNRINYFNKIINKVAAFNFSSSDNFKTNKIINNNNKDKDKTVTVNKEPPKIEGDIIINSHKQVLIYFDKETLNDKIRFHIPNLAIISLGLAFIIKNPLYITFPAALPVSVFYVVFKIFNYIKKIYDRKNILSRVWLHPSGDEIRIVLSDSLTKGTSEVEMAIGGIYESPNTKEMTYNAEEFPKSYEEYLKPSRVTLLHYWKKYLTIDKQVVYIKKKPVYTNMEVLINILNNKKIEYGKNEAYLLDEEADEYEQIKAIKELMYKYNNKNTKLNSDSKI